MQRASRSCDEAAVTERRSVEVLSRDDEAGAILPSNFCRRTVAPNVSLNAEQTLLQTDLTSAKIRAKQNEPKVGESFAKRKQPSDPLFQSADAPARGRAIKDVNVGESLAERKKPSVLWCRTAYAPASHQECQRSQGTDKFFYHSAVGWFVGRGKIAAGQDNYRQIH